MASGGDKKPVKHHIKSPFGLHVTAYVGDVVDAVADAIVTPEDTTMSHMSYVTQALVDRDILFERDREELRLKHLTFPLWSVFSTMTRKKQTVFHVFLAACKPSTIKAWTINMGKLYNKLFQEADKNGVLVLALPLLGAGTRNVDAAIQVAVNCVAVYKPKSLTDVLLVSTDEDIVYHFVSFCKFEFSGRPQSDKTIRTVTFEVDEDDDDDDGRSKKKKKTKKGKGKGKVKGRGKGKSQRLRSNEDSDDSWAGSRTPERSPSDDEESERTNQILNSRIPRPQFRGNPTIFMDLTNVSSDDEKAAYKKLKSSKYSPSNSEEEEETDDGNVVRLSMKGSKVNIDGKTYYMNMTYEGSPLLKSAEDVREKISGQVSPRKSLDTPKESKKSPRKPKNVSPVRHIPNPSKSVPKMSSSLYKPTKTTTKQSSSLSSWNSTNAASKSRALVKQPIPKLNVSGLSNGSGKQQTDEDLDTPRRTKSGELGRTRKRSQSLAAKVELEALELLRAEHEKRKSSESQMPASSRSTSEWPSKGHSFTPHANVLSSQNRSSWSSGGTDDETDVNLNSNNTLDCPICLRIIKDPKRLDKCGHVFCRKCIDNSFASYKPLCPSCNTVYGVITGNQPEGTMDVSLSDERLPGYRKYDTVVITYNFPNGIQGPEHPNPGQPYKGTTRKAYLPNTTKGTEILRLLRTAFKRKLTFTIVRSESPDKGNVVTWNDIHHKTNIKGGPTRFGYPDEKYLSRVKEDLLRKGVTE